VNSSLRTIGLWLGAPLTFGFISAVTGERENNGVDNWLVRVCQ